MIHDVTWGKQDVGGDETLRLRETIKWLGYWMTMQTNWNKGQWPNMAKIINCGHHHGVLFVESIVITDQLFSSGHFIICYTSRLLYYSSSQQQWPVTPSTIHSNDWLLQISWGSRRKHVIRLNPLLFRRNRLSRWYPSSASPAAAKRPPSPAETSRPAFFSCY